MKTNAQQKKAITHKKGPLLIIAGAGTGKTAVITQRLAYLIKSKKTKPEEILALTFTDKAAGEMEERVDKLLPYGYTDLWISTFHSFGQRVLKDHALDIGLDPVFKLLNQTEQWRLIRQNFEKFDLNYYKPRGNPTRFIYALIKVFSRAKDENISPKDFIEYGKKLTKKTKPAKEERARILEVARSFKIYENLLKEKGYLDFGDLIIKTLELFQKRKNILEKYQKQFKYILVDEFQDTNYAQYELIKLLSAPRNNLTVTGDDDQAIYKFRGAAVSNIIEFKKDFPGSKEIVLKQNYRNRQNILDLSYNFIQLNNPNRLEAKINQKKKNLKSRITKKLKANKKGRGEIKHLHFKTQDEEALGVVKKIIDLRKKQKSLTWNDFAILVRANNQADLFINVLEHQEIPYQYVAKSGLFQKPEIIDLISYLKLLDNYHESTAMYRVLAMPIFKVTVNDIMKLLYRANKKNKSLFEILDHINEIEGISPSTKKTVKEIIEMIKKQTQTGQKKGTLKALYQFVSDSNLFKYLSQKQSKKAHEKILNINQFFKVASNFERLNQDKTVKNFMQELELAQEAGETGPLKNNLEEGPDSVKVMTIHQAKGLEFEHVFVVNLVNKRFPSINRRDPIELPDNLIKETLPSGDIHLQEERRLFYVAITRAKKGIYLTSADNYGGSRKKKLSKFLYETGLVKKDESGPKQKKEKLIINSFSKKHKFKRVKDDLAYLPQKFSYTQIRAFETCPYQYRLAHILKVPVKGKGTFSFGKSIHRTLYDFYRMVQQDKKPSQKDLLSLYRKNWLDEWYDSKDHELTRKKQGEKALKKFYKINKDSLKVPMFLEKGFNIKFGDYTVKGFIDRMDEIRKDSSASSGGAVEIIDYKTGNLPSSKNKIDFKQLFIYALASWEVFKLKPLKLTYYYIEDNKKFSVQPQKKEAQKIKKEVTETIEQIMKSDFKATPSKYKCRYCDFKNICQYRKV
ncbi:MAG: UvrD-helicase domain-containing protein [Patescibacteria group bacterium]|nr:UvrD-helicase domain-containing protein [Patescibacteria group bacterium]